MRLPPLLALTRDSQSGFVVRDAHRVQTGEVVGHLHDGSAAALHGFGRERGNRRAARRFLLLLRAGGLAGYFAGGLARALLRRFFSVDIRAAAAFPVGVGGIAILVGVLRRLVAAVRLAPRLLRGERSLLALDRLAVLALETPPGLLRGRLRGRLRDRRPLRRRRVALRFGDGIRLRLGLGADLRLGAVLLAHLRRLLGSLLGADLLGDALLLARLLLRGHALLGDVRGVRVLPPVVIRRVRVERRDGLVEVRVVAERATGRDVHATRGAVVVAARGGWGFGVGVETRRAREGTGRGQSRRGSDSRRGIVNRGGSERGKRGKTKDAIRAYTGEGDAQLADVLLDALGAEAVQARRHHLHLLHRAPAHGAPRVMAHRPELHRRGWA